MYCYLQIHTKFQNNWKSWTSSLVSAHWEYVQKNDNINEIFKKKSEYEWALDIFSRPQNLKCNHNNPAMN